MTEILSLKESASCSYNLHKTDAFVKSFRKLDHNVQKMLDKTIHDVLSVTPFESKRLLSPNLRGKRSLRSGNYRIIFSICEECRQLHDRNNCFNCNQYGTKNNVVIFMVGHRKNIYV